MVMTATNPCRIKKSKLVTKISCLPAEVPHARPQEVRFITCYVGFNNLLQCYIPSWFKGGGGRGYIVCRKKGEQGGEGMGKGREEEGERERKKKNWGASSSSQGGFLVMLF